MSLLIDAPIVENRLRMEAQRRGLSAADLATTILSAHLGTAPADDAEKASTRDAADVISPVDWNATRRRIPQEQSSSEYNVPQGLSANPHT